MINRIGLNYKVIIFIYLFLLCEQKVSFGQSSQLVFNEFINSSCKDVFTEDDSIYLVLAQASNFEEIEYSNIIIYSLYFNNENHNFNLNLRDTIKLFGITKIIAVKYIKPTRNWIIVQAINSENELLKVKVVLYDRNFNLLSEEIVDSIKNCYIFSIDYNESFTYILGSVEAENGFKLLHLKYNHFYPFTLSPIYLKQSTPSPINFLTSMKIDKITGDMIVFSYDGISVLDSNLHQVKNFNSTEVMTSDHGHIVSNNVDYYYSHGARDSAWDNGLRKLVLHKYDTAFNIIAADTLGWSGQDNYPFLESSIDLQNSKIIIGGHLDGPLNSLNFSLEPKKFYIAYYDDELNQIWYKEFGGDIPYILNGIKILNDSLMVAYGKVIDTIHYESKAFLLVININENLTTYSELPHSESKILTINTLVKDFIEIRSELIGIHFILTDINGTVVKDDVLFGELSNYDVSYLTTGMYPYFIFEGQFLLRSGILFKL